MLQEALDWIGLLLIPKALPLLPLLAHTPGPPPDDAEDVLEAPRRKAMHEAILAQPGISVGDLANQLDLGAGTFYHHLRRLVAAGLVQTREVGKKTFVYPTGAAPTDHALLAQDTPRRIAQLLLDTGSLDSDQLATRLTIPVRTVRYHLRRLVGEGFILSTGGQHPEYSPTPQLRTALQ